jgi:hypothetical protein
MAGKAERLFEQKMRIRWFAPLLFGLALVAQSCAPLAGAAAHAAQQMGMSPAFCDILRSGHTSADPKSAPAGHHEHKADCALCAAFVGAPPLVAVAGARLDQVATRQAPKRALARAPVASARILNDGAPPRAPPSFV